MLDDGTYDVFVVDADPLGEEGDGRGYRLELTIVAGARRGEVVSVTAEGLTDPLFDLIGMPGTLTVDGGAPAVRIDR